MTRKTGSLKKSICIVLSVLFVLTLCSCAKKGIEGIPPNTFTIDQSYSQTGTDHGFSPVHINCYYEHLTEKQREIYINIYNTVEEMHKGDVLLAKGATKDDLTTAINAYYADNPQHFWVAESSEICWTDTNNLGIILKKIGNWIAGLFGPVEESDYSEYTDVYCKFNYIFKDKQQRDSAQQELYTVIGEMLSGISAEQSVFERELYLHDRLCETCTYDSEAFAQFIESGSVGDRISCHTAYGALVNKTATCAGYARAMQLLLSEAGIESRFITGMRDDAKTGATVAHAWNVVFIDGMPYHLDATGNDKDEWGIASGAYVEVKPDGKTYYNTGNRTEHRYFNVTEDEISKDHYGFQQQLAMSDKAWYFTVEQLNFEDPDASLKQALTDKLVQQRKSENLFIELYAGQNSADQKQYLNVLVNGEDGMLYKCLREANITLGEKYYREDLVYYGLDNQSGIISVYTVPNETTD